MLVDTSNARYHVGEKWSFQSRPGEENATFTILKVETDEKRGGVIVHITVEGVRIKCAQAPSGFSETVGHMPFDEAAIDKSVTRLVAKDVQLPPFEDGYQQWRTAFDSGKGGIFTITVGEGIAFLEKAME